MTIRIGHGYDVHRFAPPQAGDACLRLGGVDIVYSRSLEAHSDGDVVLHALCDALLGAAALGDIGQHFPDTDPAFKGIDSRTLLRQTVALVHAQGFAVNNADMTIIAQQPRLAPYIPAMRAAIAQDLTLALSISKPPPQRGSALFGAKKALPCMRCVYWGQANENLKWTPLAGQPRGYFKEQT